MVYMPFIINNNLMKKHLPTDSSAHAQNQLWVVPKGPSTKYDYFMRVSMGENEENEKKT